MPSFNYDFPYASKKLPVFAENVVASSQHLAATAGLRMMAKGGNAVDAAIAAGVADPDNLFVTGGSGGGVLTSWIIGKTDRQAGEASERPVHIGEVFSTLYNRMGIDTQQVTLTDLGGRPQYLVDLEHQPIRELV